MNKLKVWPFTFAGGLVWLSGVLMLWIVVKFVGVNSAFLDLISSLYKGFDLSVKGLFIGMGWAFVDAGIASLIFVLLYNLFVEKSGE